VSATGEQPARGSASIGLPSCVPFWSPYSSACCTWEAGGVPSPICFLPYRWRPHYPEPETANSTSKAAAKTNTDRVSMVVAPDFLRKVRSRPMTIPATGSRMHTINSR